MQVILTNPHSSAADICVAKLGSSPTGLNSVDARHRLAENGPNSLPLQTGKSPLLRFIAHFHNALIYVLIGSALVTAALQHWTDTAIILAVVLINAIIGFIQEGRAENAMAAIRSMLSPRASVLRDAKRVTIPAGDVVCGDIVLLEAGDRISADVRILAARGLKVQEAVLTGESVPVEKSNVPVATDASLGDRTSMGYSGTIVVAGSGRGVATATGQKTEIGHISGMLRDVNILTTPLVEQMNRFAQWLSAMILILAGILLIFGYFVEHIPFEDMFMAVVGLTVAAIPEGLPAVLTITLAIGVRRMAKRHVIVRKLPSIETLGAVSVICTDKTGTLTRNEMMVASIALPSGNHVVDGVGYAPEGRIEPEPERRELVQLATIAALCNDAALRDANGQWQVDGDPMEGALLAFVAKTNFDVTDWQRLDEIPFDAGHRYMAVLVQAPAGARHVLVKGAPEQVQSMCSNQISGASTQPLDKGNWHAAADQVASKGQRVLAFATMPTEARKLTKDLFDGHMTFAGMAGLIDPPRAEAIDAVAECYRAGIAVKMITGDHVGTATAIGSRIGLQNTDHALSGVDIEKMSDAELAAAVRETNIFARTSPEQKLRLVTALQADNLIVAMTGDGVNDAPALKRADAGIAMGAKGSEAAKEAAALVLANDNFTSIVAAVREGRTVFDNLRKVISWTLPTSAGEAATIVIALLLGLVLPISPVQILWINLITAVTLGLALAFEPTEPGTMERKPRMRSAPLLTGELVWHIILVGALFACAVFGLFAYSMDQGYSQELAQTLTMNMVVILEIFHLFFIRNIYGTSLTWAAVRGTKAVWICLAVIVPAQFIVTYVPVAQRALGTSDVSLTDGLLMLAVGVVFFVIIEIEKQLRLSLSQSDTR